MVQVFVVLPRSNLIRVRDSKRDRRHMNYRVVNICFSLYMMALVRCVSNWVDDSVLVPTVGECEVYLFQTIGSQQSCQVITG